MCHAHASVANASRANTAMCHLYRWLQLALLQTGRRAQVTCQQNRQSVPEVGSKVEKCDYYTPVSCQETTPGTWLLIHIKCQPVGPSSQYSGEPENADFNRDRGGKASNSGKIYVCCARPTEPETRALTAREMVDLVVSGIERIGVGRMGGWENQGKQ